MLRLCSAKVLLLQVSSSGGRVVKGVVKGVVRGGGRERLVLRRRGGYRLPGCERRYRRL